MKFAHVNIVALDWKKLAEFYVDTFNCKIVPPIRSQSGEWLERGTGLKGAKLEGAHLLLPGHGETGPTLEIYQYGTTLDEPPIPPNRRGIGHVAFEVEDVEEILEKLEENGGYKFGNVTKRKIPGAGEITFIYTRDPEGNLLELQHWNRKDDTSN